MPSLRWICLLPIAAAPVSAEMTALGDGELSDVSGQSGLVLEAAINLSIDAISYFDDGNGVSLRDLTISAIGNPEGQATHEYQLDVTNTGGLVSDFEMSETRLVIGGITFSDNANRSLGSIIYDFSQRGTLYTEAYNGNGLRFNLSTELSNGRFVYRDGGNELILDDINATTEIRDMILSVAVDPNDPETMPFINLGIGDARTTYSVGAIRYSNDDNVFGGIGRDGSVVALPSYGSIRGDSHTSTNVQISGGGRVGTSGLNLDLQHQLHSGNFYYRDGMGDGSDQGHELGLVGMSGLFDMTNLTLDVAQGDNERLGLLLGFDEFTGQLRIDEVRAPRVRLDAATGQLVQETGSFGRVDLDFRFADQQVGDRLYSNRFLIQGHEDENETGISIAAEWSLADATLRYEDEYVPGVDSAGPLSVYIQDLSSYGSGTLTLDVTSAGDATETYDGVRIGFQDVQGSYRIKGLSVGDYERAAGDEGGLQGGSELLLALGLFPAYDFNLNGHYTFAPGGAAGEGITINADIYVTDGKAGIAALRPEDIDGGADYELRGLWASDLNYDVHLRDMTVDVTEEGLALVRGESWSTMDIGNLVVGGKNDSHSFGRFVISSYQQGSSMTISPGGAGTVCVGGLIDGVCSGEWEDRGDQGVTIALKNILVPASNGRSNSFMWETNRVDGVNGTGTQVALSNITTNDGEGNANNTYGLQTDLNVDVYQTRVMRKTEGGYNRLDDPMGQEKVMNADGSYRWVPVAELSEADMANRPLGFAVKGNVRFKELSIDQVQLKHPNASEAQVVMHGMKMQNFDIKANLTATPIQ